MTYSDAVYDDLLDTHRVMEDVITIIKADIKEDMIEKITRLVEEETGRNIDRWIVEKVIHEKSINLEDI